ncbi:MAG: sigma factor-like helix-turn-helix DNA-binding protein [Candidatus Gracilibacteria bacterium]|jgi:RNA polymerase sigma factor (sigma-70 family)
MEKIEDMENSGEVGVAPESVEGSAEIAEIVAEVSATTREERWDKINRGILPDSKGKGDYTPGALTRTFQREISEDARIELRARCLVLCDIEKKGWGENIDFAEVADEVVSLFEAGNWTYGFSVVMHVRFAICRILKREEFFENICRNEVDKISSCKKVREPFAKSASKKFIVAFLARPFGREFVPMEEFKRVLELFAVEDKKEGMYYSFSKRLLRLMAGEEVEMEELVEKKKRKRRGKKAVEVEEEEVSAEEGVTEDGAAGDEEVIAEEDGIEDAVSAEGEAEEEGFEEFGGILKECLSGALSVGEVKKREEGLSALIAEMAKNPEGRAQVLGTTMDVLERKIPPNFLISDQAMSDFVMNFLFWTIDTAKLRTIDNAKLKAEKSFTFLHLVAVYFFVVRRGSAKDLVQVVSDFDEGKWRNITPQRWEELYVEAMAGFRQNGAAFLGKFLRNAVNQSGEIALREGEVLEDYHIFEERNVGINQNSEIYDFGQEVDILLAQAGNKVARKKIGFRMTGVVTKLIGLNGKLRGRLFKLGLTAGDFGDLFHHVLNSINIQISKTNPCRGRVSTYIVPWIYQVAGRYAEDHGLLVRVPVHIHSLCGYISNLRREIALDAKGEGLDPKEALRREEETGRLRDEVIAKGKKTLLKNVREAKRMLRLSGGVVRSLSEPVGGRDGDSEATLGDFLPQVSVLAGQDAGLEVEEEHEGFDEICQSLSPRDRIIFKARFVPKANVHYRQLEVVGKELGVTRERVRQIEINLKKISETRFDDDGDDDLEWTGNFKNFPRGKERDYGLGNHSGWVLVIRDEKEFDDWLLVNARDEMEIDFMKCFLRGWEMKDEMSKSMDIRAGGMSGWGISFAEEFCRKKYGAMFGRHDGERLLFKLMNRLIDRLRFDDLRSGGQEGVAFAEVVSKRLYEKRFAMKFREYLADEAGSFA